MKNIIFIFLFYYFTYFELRRVRIVYWDFWMGFDAKRINLKDENLNFMC